jgi:hypothetical protein
LIIEALVLETHDIRMGFLPYLYLGLLPDLRVAARFAMLKSNDKYSAKWEEIMEQVVLVVSVAAAFLLRIGVPVILLIGLGILIDRWQSKREKSFSDENRKAA